MLWLASVSVVVAVATAVPEPPPAEPPLPGALPPLDDALLEGADDGVTAFGHGRVRAVAEDATPKGRDALAGAGLTGRAGVRGHLGDVRGAVVLGDGAWWVTPTQPTSTTTELLPTTLTLVPVPVAAVVQRLSVDVPLSPLGAPGQLTVGRFPLTLADGRFVGVEPFDARGRSFDGAVVDTALSKVLVKTGVVALDLGAVPVSGAGGDDDEVAPFSVLGFAAASVDMPGDDADFDDVAVDVYLLGHHRGTTLRPTLGARGSVDVFGLRLAGGVDGQLALDETAGLARRGAGLHGELSAKTLLPWALPAPRPFLTVAVEGTGDVVAPAPTQHGTMGDLDLVSFQNTWQLVASAGVEDDGGFAAAVTWRRVRALGDVRDPRGAAIDDSDFGYGEIDVDLAVPVAEGVGFDVGWAVALDDDGLVAQRVLFGLSFSFGDDDGLLPPL